MAKWWTAVLAALTRTAAFFALWLLLVDATDLPNLLTGAVCAIAAAGLATVVHSLRSVHARVRPLMLRRAYRPFLLLLTDTGRVMGALFAHLVLRRQIRGSFRAARYRARGEGSDDVGRRVLSEWAASLAANRYSIGIDRERNLMLVHEMVEAGGPLDPLELG
jgi:hypothetical protein